MAIDISREHFITPVEVTRLRPAGRNGRPMSLSTVYRHFFRGVRNVRCEYVRFGGHIYTSREAVQRFVDRLSSVTDRRELKPSHTINQDQVEHELSKLGF
jgi:hypothetical protein